MAQEFTFTVNGVERTTTQNKPLLRYLRDDLHIHSAKDGCSEGACGTCTIHVDGAAVKACVLTTALAAGRNIVTVEGLPEDVREAFVYAFGAVGAVQCGFCIPGMVMAGAALIAEDRRAHRGADQVRHPRQRLPLHRLQKDYRGHLAGRCGAPWRKADRRGPGARR